LSNANDALGQKTNSHGIQAKRIQPNVNSAPTSPAKVPTPTVGLLAISILSFLLYAAGVMALHQDRSSSWSVEFDAPIPGAISHIVYGTPWGAIDANVRAFLGEQRGHGVAQAVAGAADGSIAPGTVDSYAMDGIGVGSILFATVAMSVFGPHVSSLVLFFLAVVGASALALSWRFQDARCFVVPVCFLALSIIFLTPLCTTSIGADQIPIGGNRYFSIAAVLPTLHIFFEINEGEPRRPRKLQILGSVLLTIQALILFGALLVRSSAGLFALVIVAILVYRLNAERRDRRKWAPLVAKLGLILAPAFFWGIVIVEALPAYVQTGRVLGNFWHRSFVSLGLHPEWPFGNLREVYDCTKEMPAGLVQGSTDHNGHCIWLVYPPNRTRSAKEVHDQVYGREYEAVVRRAFLDVLTSYPEKVLELFVYIKSLWVLRTLREAFHLQPAAVPKVILPIVGIQFVIFISVIVASARRQIDLINRQISIIFVFFIMSIVPLYVAWAVVWTSVDAIFFMYSSLAIVLAFVIQSAIKFVWAPRAYAA
jgi:hypothetical protein